MQLTVTGSDAIYVIHRLGTTDINGSGTATASDAMLVITRLGYSINPTEPVVASSPIASGRTASLLRTGAEAVVSSSLLSLEMPTLASLNLSVSELDQQPRLMLGEQFEVVFRATSPADGAAVFAACSDIVFDPAVFRADALYFDDDGTIFRALMTALGSGSSTISTNVADDIGSETVLYRGDSDIRSQVAQASLAMTVGQSPDVVITLIGSDIVAVSRVGERLQVLINGVIDPAYSGLAASVRSITVIGGVGNNRIDLSAVTLADFPNLRGVSASGGLGNDVIVGSEFADIISGNEGRDHLSGNGGSDSINGGIGNDSLFGGNDADVLNGLAGADFLRGDDGDDTLLDGTGRDILHGSAGNDSLMGQAGPASLFGGDGDDTLKGAADNDTPFDGGGSDRLFGLLGDDILQGDDGADSLMAGPGNDILRGGAGADTLQGNLGNDTLDGGADTDRISEVFDADVTIVGQNVTTTQLGSDAAANVERINVTGSDSRNFLDARQAAVPVSLNGLGGNDTLLGGQWTDTLNGGDGNDVLSGGASSDVLDGGAGSDTFDNDAADSRVTDTADSVIANVFASPFPIWLDRF